MIDMMNDNMTLTDAMVLLEFLVCHAEPLSSAEVRFRHLNLILYVNMSLNHHHKNVTTSEQVESLGRAIQASRRQLPKSGGH
jgi:hypothetical protein